MDDGEDFKHRTSHPDTMLNDHLIYKFKLANAASLYIS